MPKNGWRANSTTPQPSSMMPGAESLVSVQRLTTASGVGQQINLPEAITKALFEWRSQLGINEFQSFRKTVRFTESESAFQSRVVSSMSRRRYDVIPGVWIWRRQPNAQLCTDDFWLAMIIDLLSRLKFLMCSLCLLKSDGLRLILYRRA